MKAAQEYNRRLLIVGNMLVNVRGLRPVGKDIQVGLETRGWNVQLVSSVENPLLRLLDMVWTVWSRRRSYAVALVDVFSGKAFIWTEVVGVVLGLCKKPFVLTLHGGGLPEFAGRYPRRVSRALRSARAVTAPSEFLQEHMRQYRPDIILLPNPVDLDVFHGRLRTAVRPVLLWVRAFHNQYEPTLAPRVVALLRNEFPEITLTMVGRDTGDGSLEATRKAIRDLNVSQHVHIVDGIDRDGVVRLLNESDIFLNTTRIDNSPVSVMEALASGLCVVSTNVGGIPYLLTDREDAVLVPGGDDLAMADAVRQILCDAGLASALSERGVRTARERSLSTIAARWEELLNRTTGEHLDPNVQNR